MYNITDKLSRRLSQKLAQTTPFRSDFVIADFKALGADRKVAKVLVHYDAVTFGVPSKEAVADTLTYLYKNAENCPRLLPDIGSVKWYPKQQALSCVVRVPTVRRPFDDVKRCRLTPIVAGTTFLGENMSDTWSVAKAEDGNIFIEKIEKDDIEDILRGRSKAKAFRSQARCTTLAAVEAAYSENKFSTGDKVKCTYNGRLVEAEIFGLSEMGAQIGLKDGTQATITIANILGLVSAGNDSTSWNKQALKDYYREAYGYGDKELESLTSYIG